MAPQSDFLEQLRDALNHFYEPDLLCRSPLGERFGVAQRPDASSALQQILIEAIKSLQPVSTPAQSRAWRIHDLLFYRFMNSIHLRHSRVKGVGGKPTPVTCDG